MTTGTGVIRVVGSICMAVSATVPGRAFVLPGIDGEIGIMNGKLGRFPAWICGVAVGAVC